MQVNPFGEKAWDFIVNPIADDSRINILEGSVRSSKTFAMHPKLLNLNATGPEGLGIITGVSKNTIYDNVLRDLFDFVGKGKYQYNRQTGDLELYGKPWKVVGAKDEGSEKYIRGITLAKAYCDELVLMPESFFKQLLNRMSVKGARLYGTTNPGSPFHWLYREYITDKEKITAGIVRVIHFTLDDNPSLSDEYKSFIKSAYKGVFYQRFIDGLWVVAEGAIYKDAWSDQNLFEDSDIERLNLFQNYVERYLPIDYGTTNPFAMYDVLDDGDTLWVVKEYYWDSKVETWQKTDAQYADDLEKFMAEDSQIIIDPSAASFKAELIQRGIVAYGDDDINADNAVLDGIRMTSNMLARKKVKVHRHKCPRLIEELPAYAWDEKAALRGEEKPIKEHDHGPDAIRYCIKTRVAAWRLAA
jgi:PBSX family phage terminase large subunit